MTRLTPSPLIESTKPQPRTTPVFADARDVICDDARAQAPRFFSSSDKLALEGVVAQLSPHGRWLSFERSVCPDRPASQVDVSVALERASAARFLETATGLWSGRIAEVVNTWRHSTEHPLASSPSIWMEFDHAEHPAAVESESRGLDARGFVFFTLGDGVVARDGDDVVHPLVSTLAPAQTSATLAATFAADAFQRMPKPARLLNVGYLDHRGNGSEVRLQIEAPLVELRGCLEAASWSGRWSTVDELVAIYRACGRRRVHFQLAFDPETSARLGLELMFPWEEGLDGWTTAADALLARDCLEPSLAQELVKWSGTSVYGAGEFAGGMLPLAVEVRRYAHIKFVMAKSGLDDVKMYLSSSASFGMFTEG